MNTFKNILAILLLFSLLSVPEAISSQQSASLMSKDSPVIPAQMPMPSQIAYSAGRHTNLSQIGDTVSIYLGMPDRLYSDIIEKAAERYNIDAALIKAIIMAESRYNHRAVSKKGAGGLMQLMPHTAKALGVQNIFDPEDNINGGVRYFKKLLNRFKGNTKLALAAYNAGSRYVRHYKGVPPFIQTKTFIKNVLKYHQSYKTDEMSSDKIV
jgi:soluble lytic murein transglycosylase-like protein